jgi:hypothetical protein
MDLWGEYLIDTHSSWRDSPFRRRLNDEFHPETKAAGWDASPAVIGKGSGIDLVPRLSK